MLLLYTNSGNPVILVLLDLSAAFDTVDQMLSSLENCVGIKGTALKWFRSYLTDRGFSVRFNGSCCASTLLTCGVTQGSVLGPILFSLYMLPLGSISRKYGISFHCYADDSQIYFPLKKNSADPFKVLLDCLYDNKSWFALNFLHINDQKTEIILFRPSDPCFSLNVDLGPLEKFRTLFAI